MLARTQSGPPSSGGGPSDSNAQDSTRRQLTLLVKTDTVIDLTEEAPSTITLIKPTKSTSFEDSPPRTNSQAANLRTYGGASRSFLIAIPANQVPSLNDSQLTEDSAASLLRSQEDDFGGHESYTSLRSRWGVDNSEDDPYQPLAESSTAWLGKKKGKSSRPPPVPLSGPSNSELRSITELRNTGESRRFNDEVGYLFEGLTAESEISVKRGSAVELVSKMADPQFSRKARSADFVMHAWETLRAADGGSGDRVLGTALDVFALLVSRDPRDLIDLANRGSLIPALFGKLATTTRKNDPLCILNGAENDIELKQRGFGRTDKLPLSNLNKVVIKSSIFSEGTQISNCLLVTRSLSTLPPSLLHHSYIATVSLMLRSELSHIPPRISAYLTGLPLLPQIRTDFSAPSFACVESCLKLLESYLLERWDHKGMDDDVPLYEALNPSRNEIIEGILSCSLATDILIREADDEDSVSQIRKCHESALRVLVNLSHDNGTWSGALLDNGLTVPMIVRFIVSSHRRIARVKSYEDKIHASDRLCLALGLLTNLVQVDERAKDLVRETLLNRTCPGRRGCIRSCNCSNRATALSSLLAIFLDHRNNQSKPGVDDPGNEMEPIIQGHTAVLFGLLMRDNLDNQTSILSMLPGDTNEQKLAVLVNTAREFVEFYREVMARVTRGRERGDGIEESQATEVDEEEDDVHVDEDFVVDDSGEKTARDVVAFLELLSDSS
ncbi:hypothetical protein BDM02DRAFT_3089375 [Thelephora ganbajun]|uniref:Uncharacterized protein n=1 Tax=Thelephora ganbajun TaxID=370292 RepID=A0ACB6ZR89_THEGA|nr:hypothetical protein BDM02DRAFT_3089375 [Thelephora ganbajun]